MQLCFRSRLRRLPQFRAKSGWFGPDMISGCAGGIMDPWHQISGLRGQISGHSLPCTLDRVHGQSRTLTGHPSPRGDDPMSRHGPRTRPTVAHAWFEIPHVKAPRITEKLAKTANTLPVGTPVGAWLHGVLPEVQHTNQSSYRGLEVRNGGEQSRLPFRSYIFQFGK